MSATVTQLKCAHEACQCVFAAGEGIDKGGKKYCSEGCASGKGCDHAACPCGD